MVKRTDRQLEKDKILDKLEEYGLNKNDIRHITSQKLRRTLHAIRREMKSISNQNVKIVIVGDSDNDYDSDCSYCDTDDSECEWCDSDDTEISLDTQHNNTEVDTDTEDDTE